MELVGYARVSIRKGQQVFDRQVDALRGGRADPARGRAGHQGRRLPRAQRCVRHHDADGPRSPADPGRLRRDGAQRHPATSEKAKKLAETDAQLKDLDARMAKAGS